MISFRPLPALTVAAGLLFAFLVGLGIWQLERLQWKLALIAQVNANMAAPAISAKEALRLGVDGAQYRHVRLNGHFDNTREAYVLATADGEPVYHVLVPFETKEGAFLVDRGRIPQALKNPDLRKAGLIEGETEVTGVWRTPDPANSFTPAPDVAARLWFSRDVVAIARQDDVNLAAPVVIEADARPNPGGWPVGGETKVEFRNQHLQYAITWFALAAGLLGVYLAYHASKGRLRLNPPAGGSN
jgi:surfeit locus 1 family protein